MVHRKGRHKKKATKRKKQKHPDVIITESVINPAEAGNHTINTTDMNEEETTQINQQTAEDITPKGSVKSKKDLCWLWAGCAGACLTILIVCLIAFVMPDFRHSNYYISEDPSLLKELLTKDLNPTDSTALTKAVQEETARRKDAIEDLLEQKLIVSSEEFASNITGYYNTLIAVLSAILIILNIFGFFSWRSNANSSLEQKQRELDDAIKNIDDSLEKNLEETFRKNLVVKEKLESMVNELIDQGEKLDDEEWEKLHLLLKQYRRKETLEAIKADETENDGEIES